jgi:hypothetical protein
MKFYLEGNTAENERMKIKDYGIQKGRGGISVEQSRLKKISKQLMCFLKKTNPIMSVLQAERSTQ